MSDKVAQNIEQLAGLPTFFIDVRKKNQVSDLIDFLKGFSSGNLTNFVKLIDIKSVIQHSRKLLNKIQKRAFPSQKISRRAF